MNMRYTMKWSGKRKSMTCYAVSPENVRMSKCIVNIDKDKDIWTISSWFTKEEYQHKGIGKKTMKALLKYCLIIHDVPVELLYIWNGTNQYVMDWLVKEFGAECTCPKAVQKKTEGEDIWESHIYRLDIDRVFRYFGIRKEDYDMAVMEAVNNSAYLNSCECPVCGKTITRGYKEETIFCSKCGQKLHLRAFTDEEVKQAIFDNQMDDYED